MTRILRTILCTHIQVRTHVKIWPIHHNKSRRECYLDNQKVPYTEGSNMTEFINGPNKGRKPWMRLKTKQREVGSGDYVLLDDWKSDPVEARETAQSKLQRLHHSLQERGSARESKPYDPPTDVVERIMRICSDFVVQTKQPVQIDHLDISTDFSLKLNLINKCIDEFKHELPSSSLNDIRTVGDLIKFYTTPVRGVNSYTDLVQRNKELPPNLHLIEDPIRYNREQDEFFGGYNAYPGCVLTVPGVRGSRKYPILNQDEFQWPDI